MFSGYGILYVFLINIITLSSASHQIHDNNENIKYDIRFNPSWPNINITFGQLSAVALDNDGHVVVFHRGSHVWDNTTFFFNNSYRQIDRGPIQMNTVVVLDTTGDYVGSWGSNRFYMPHGLTIDADDNVWLTDVALHQVFKISPQGDTVLLTLGVKFEPGTDSDHFCKPTSVAVMYNGDFFVADGYCNSRIVKYSRSGTRLLQWGSSGTIPFSHYSLSVPHALAIINETNQVCVADREHGRIACYNYFDGAYRSEFKFPAIGSRLFSIAYCPVEGGKFYVVNGPNFYPTYKVQGFIINIPENRIEASFAPDYGLSNPHDIAVNDLGNIIYVVELSPMKIHRFEIISRNIPAKQETVGDSIKRPQMMTAATISAPADNHQIGQTILIILIVIIICIITFFIASRARRNKDKKRYGKLLDDTDNIEGDHVFAD